MIGSSPIIDGLTQLERIGSGGSAAVYKAYEETHDRWVAIKVIHGVNDPDAARRFARETRAMGRLSEHEGIVTIHSSGLTAKDAPYLVMPYLANGSLQDQIDSDGPVAWPKAIDWMTSVARTVEWAHTRQVIHRDLKPANILLSGTNLPLVADFGIARLQEGTNSLQSQSVALTPRYSPPEVITDAATSVVSDVYGLAATLFALLQGSSPFTPSDGSDENLLAVLYRVANEPVADLRPSGVPPEICEAVEVSMSKSPDDRPQSAAAFADLLKAASEQARTRITDATVPAQVPGRETSPARASSVTDPKVTSAPRKPRSRKRRRSKRGSVVVGAAALSIVVLGAGALLISTRDEPSTVAAEGQAPQTLPSAPADVTSPPLGFPSSTTFAAAIQGNTGGPASATTGLPVGASEEEPILDTTQPTPSRTATAPPAPSSSVAEVTSTSIAATEPLVPPGQPVLEVVLVDSEHVVDGIVTALPTDSSLAPRTLDDDWTIEATAQTTHSESTQYLAGVFSSAAASRFYVGTSRDRGGIRIGIGSEIYETGVQIDDGTLHSIHVLFDANGGEDGQAKVTLVIDGVERWTATQDANPSLPDRQLRIGEAFDYERNNFTQPWTGLITRLAVYDYLRVEQS